MGAIYDAEGFAVSEQARHKQLMLFRLCLFCFLDRKKKTMQAVKTTPLID
jgi:hypothetical protein